jgi:cytochrome b561
MRRNTAHIGLEERSKKERPLASRSTHLRLSGNRLHNHTGLLLLLLLALRTCYFMKEGVYSEVS